MSVAARKLAVEQKHFGGPTTSIRLTAQERDTILAALRHWQNRTNSLKEHHSDLDKIATGDGQHEALSLTGIDMLCQDLNQ